jgi:hypothetical protein
MTFRVETVLDQNYFCQSGHGKAKHATDLDRLTWTCRTCNRAVEIAMDDGAGHRYTVERRPVREIRVDDEIVFRTNTVFVTRRVLASSPSQRRSGKWRLAVEAFGSDDNMRPEQYISRVVKNTHDESFT